jgi:hypothetical protein
VSTYTGPTEVQDGILSVGATGSIAKSSQINLSTPTSKFDVTQTAAGYVIPATQRVLGSGDWDGRIVLDGTLVPGNNGIGILTGDDLTFDGAGVMQFELGALDNSSDLLTLSGAFDKGTAGAFRFDFANTARMGRRTPWCNFSARRLPQTTSASPTSLRAYGEFLAHADRAPVCCHSRAECAARCFCRIGLAGLRLRRRR